MKINKEAWELDDLRLQISDTRIKKLADLIRILNLKLKLKVSTEVGIVNKVDKWKKKYN